MELQPRDAPLPPFFAAVRRRHPDVDIVLLPPESPAGPPGPRDAEGARAPASEDQLANAYDLTTGTATRIWAEVVGDGQVPETRVRFGADQASVTVRARLSTRLDESRLDALAAALEAGGWEVGRRRDVGGQLFARRRSTQLVASYAEATGTFVVTVTSPSLLVGVERARELARR